MTRMYERYDDEKYANVIKNHVTGEILDDAGEIAVEDIRYNGKDSYIVKHDVASKLLKELIRS